MRMRLAISWDPWGSDDEIELETGCGLPSEARHSKVESPGNFSGTKSNIQIEIYIYIKKKKKKKSAIPG